VDFLLFEVFFFFLHSQHFLHHLQQHLQQSVAFWNQVLMKAGNMLIAAEKVDANHINKIPTLYVKQILQ
jgi:hypothetical protein